MKNYYGCPVYDSDDQDENDVDIVQLFDAAVKSVHRHPSSCLFHEHHGRHHHGSGLGGLGEHGGGGGLHEKLATPTRAHCDESDLCFFSSAKMDALLPPPTPLLIPLLNALTPETQEYLELSLPKHKHCFHMDPDENEICFQRCKCFKLRRCCYCILKDYKDKYGASPTKKGRKQKHIVKRIFLFI